MQLKDIGVNDGGLVLAAFYAFQYRFDIRMVAGIPSQVWKRFKLDLLDQLFIAG